MVIFIPSSRKAKTSVLHAENKAKVGDQEYQESGNWTCPLHLYPSAYNMGSWQNPQCTMWLQIYTKHCKTRSYTGAFVVTDGTTNSTSCDITKTAKWHGLEDSIQMDWLHAERQKYYSHIQRRNKGGAVAKCCMQRGTLLPHNCEAWLRWTHRGTQKWQLYI